MAALVETQLSLLDYMFIIALYRFTQYAINCINVLFFLNKIGEITNMWSLLLSCIKILTLNLCERVVCFVQHVID